MKIRKPDDWHLHLRDGDVLAAVVPHTAAHFGRALVMPNLVPPVRTVVEARAYRDRIRAHAPEFEPLMTLYLTDHTTPEMIREAVGDVLACKLYPAGATTHSDAGVSDLDGLEETLACMAEVGMVLCVHGEVTTPSVDIFDREARFLDDVLVPLLERHPTLRVVIEHATTREAVQLAATSPRLAASITAHHLRYDRNALFEGGIRPHRYCLPILKRREHQLALIEAATSGDSHYFLGTDSAPHLRHRKENPCGCAGMYTAPVALPMVAEVFEDSGTLEALESFVSLNGAAFYGLEPAVETVELEKVAFKVPLEYQVGTHTLRPAAAGEVLRWSITDGTP